VTRQKALSPFEALELDAVRLDGRIAKVSPE